MAAKKEITYDDPLQAFQIRVDHPPRTKGRPRLGRKRKAYTPQNTIDAEQIIAQAWADAGGPKFVGPVRMEISYDKRGQTILVTPVDWWSTMRGDVDNYAKLTSDALNDVAYVDDRQIVCLIAKKV